MTTAQAAQEMVDGLAQQVSECAAAITAKQAEIDEAAAAVTQAQEQHALKLAELADLLLCKDAKQNAIGWFQSKIHEQDPAQ